MESRQMNIRYREAPELPEREACRWILHGSSPVQAARLVFFLVRTVMSFFHGIRYQVIWNWYRGSTANTVKIILPQNICMRNQRLLVKTRENKGTKYF